MKRRGHSLDAIISAVKQHELGMPATEVARKMGVAEATSYRWKRAYGGPEPDEVRLMSAVAGRELRVCSDVIDMTRCASGEGLLDTLCSTVPVGAPLLPQAVSARVPGLGRQETAIGSARP